MGDWASEWDEIDDVAPSVLDQAGAQRAGDLDLSDAGADPDDEQRQSDAQAWAEHDLQGTDLASQIARRIAGSSAVSLPPSRGVVERRTRQRTSGVSFSSAHPDERDPQQVGDVLGRVAGDRGWSTQINVRTVLGRWPDLVGPVNAEHSTPEHFSKGVLTVRTESTAWATQLRHLAPQLVAELNRRLGEGTVLRIQVIGPNAPSWKHGSRSIRGARGPRDTYG